MKNPSLTVAAPATGAPSSAGAGDASPDATRLHAQLAAAVEGERSSDFPAGGEPRALLEFVRALLNAQAIALIPASVRTSSEACIVTTRGVAAANVAQFAARLETGRASAEPAPAFGAAAMALATPVRLGGEPIYTLFAIVTVPNPRDVQAFLVLLQALAGFVLYGEQRRATAELDQVLERVSGLLEIFRRTGDERDFEKACRIAVDALREYFGCERVVLGLRRRGAMYVQAISGIARLDPKSPALASLPAALSEVVSAGSRVDFTPEIAKSDATIAHEILQQQTGASRLTTIPFSRRRGALLIEWSTAAPPAIQSTKLIDAAASVLPAYFDLLARARPNPIAFHAERIWAKAGARKRQAWIAAACAATVLLAWPFHYRIGADCRLAPTVKRVIAAPFQGQLRKSHAQPGDRVSEGQPLAEMDNRELRLKEAELLAGRERALKQRDRAMSNTTGEGADFAAAQIANFDAQSIGEELALLQRKLALLEVKSPLAGIVLSGDLRRAEGQPVQQGQVLFEVAPLEKMIVEIEAPDREISRVREGMPLRFRVEAFGGNFASRVERIHPQSEQREGRNVFICEAAIANSEGAALRPGMRGRVTIESERRPLIWSLGHRLWEWLVTTLLW